MSAKTVTVVAAAILVGGTLMASAANTATPQITTRSADHNIYCGHADSAAINPEQEGFMYAGHNMYAGHKASAMDASAIAPYGYKDAPGDHALGGGPG